MIEGELAVRVEQPVERSATPFVLATVVRARHPTSVRPGDAAMVLGDGTIDGFVGGVCAESSVRLHSLRAMETGEPLLLRPRCRRGPRTTPTPTPTPAISTGRSSSATRA